MAPVRKPFQGVWNIIRFNRHFYILASLFLTFLLLLMQYYHYLLSLFFATAGSIFISLAVSYYVYDRSALYTFNWLDALYIHGNKNVVNIHAGFDETSALLKTKFADAELIVLDFYDPGRHTEVSIKRARKAYPPFPGTRMVATNNLLLPKESADLIFTILAAHEIRDERERIAFFLGLNRALKPSGKIIVTEHLRDAANFLAYNIGFFHFYSKTSWLHTFRSAHLKVTGTIQITPFITTFLLEKNGVAS